MAEVFVDDYSNIATFANADEVFTALNYPVYFRARGSIANNEPMSRFSDTFAQSQLLFGDALSDMAVFFENHDNPRFLSEANDLKKYENAIALIHTWTGIPTLYYGCEQDMAGGNDPDNRRPLWEFGYNQ